MQIAFCKKYMIRGKMMSCFMTSKAFISLSQSLRPNYTIKFFKCKVFERHFLKIFKKNFFKAFFTLFINKNTLKDYIMGFFMLFSGALSFL